MTLDRLAWVCIASLALFACGGTKLVKDAAPVPQRELPIAVAADATLAAELNFIIVRNGPGGTAGGGAAAAAGGFFLAAPVLVGVGIVRIVNNSKVDNRIESRATALPLTIPSGSDVFVDVFFPITPSPREVIVHYRTAQGDQRIRVDTSAVLAGLHLGTPPASSR